MKILLQFWRGIKRLALIILSCLFVAVILAGFIFSCMAINNGLVALFGEKAIAIFAIVIMILIVIFELGSNEKRS